jgi:7,8-dihydropterin-6-yl-methyl-4-(beta-D-ribofuranosyl)aminobenzene 5'-phosphate synthase
MRHKLFALITVFILAGWDINSKGFPEDPQSVFFSRATQEPANVEEAVKAPEVSLISVYDNCQVNPELESAWGFACVVKTCGGMALFDTGGDSGILLSNMEKMNIDPKLIDTVILSHIHQDHAGGLKGFLEKNNKVKVFVPRSFPDSFKEMITRQKAEVVNVTESGKISNCLYTTGELYGPPEEQSLVIKMGKGLILITGCAHPGILNIIRKTKEIFPGEEVYLVLGGFHHPSIAVVDNFRKLGIQKVAPTHCTGNLAREAFRKEYKEDFIEYGVGKVINIDSLRAE